MADKITTENIQYMLIGMAIMCIVYGIISIIMTISRMN